MQYSIFMPRQFEQTLLDIGYRQIGIFYDSAEFIWVSLKSTQFMHEHPRTSLDSLMCGFYLSNTEHFETVVLCSKSLDREGLKKLIQELNQCQIDT